MRIALLIGALVLVLPVAAQAGIVALDDSDTWVTGGADTAAGFYPNIEMISTIDSISNGTSVSSLATGGAGGTGASDTIGFSPSTSKGKVGTTWSTWSHSAQPHILVVYDSKLTITMCDNVGAFDFYLEPNAFQTLEMTATADDGTTVTQKVDGYYGAKYFGFYATGGSVIDSVTVTLKDSSIFAIGEMRIAAVPLPAAAWLGFALLGGMGVVGSIRRRLRR